MGISLTEAKLEAKRLRADAIAKGQKLPHGEALEQVAHVHGFRDWNSMSAAIGARPPLNWQPGGHVSGYYLGHRFDATVKRCEALRPGWFRLALDLHEAVDVVSWEGFTNIRNRIRGEVGPKGVSKEQTSDGKPHLQIDM